MSVDVVGQWINWLRIASAATTVAAYEWELRALERFFPDRSVTELKTADLARYIAHRRAVQKCGDATIRRTVNALKAFYKFACKGNLRTSPARSLPVPKTKKKKQRSLTWAQVEQLMLACDTSSVRGKRDLALICLLLDSGLREAEVCRLTLDNVDLVERRLTVRIKGGDDGDGIFGLDTQQALMTWLAMRALYAQPGVSNFFVSVGGLKPGMPITPSGLRVIFRRLGAAAGFEKLSPHDLRRSFATLSSKLGAPSRIVQVAGRWENIEMVEQYTRDLEADDFARYSPVSHAMRQKL